MADLLSNSLRAQTLSFSCSHSLFVPKPLHRSRIPASILFHKRSVTHNTYILSNAKSSSSSSSDSVSGDFDIVSATECSDGSVLFRFGYVSEISEKSGDKDLQNFTHEVVEGGAKVGSSNLSSEDTEKLNMSDAPKEKPGTENINDKELDHTSRVGIELESSSLREQMSNSTEVVHIVDRSTQVLENETEDSIPNSDLEKIVIVDSLKTGENIKLNSVEDGKYEDVSEDVSAEVNDSPSISEESAEVYNHKEDFVSSSTVTLNSDMSANLNIDSSEEVEEKDEADTNTQVDRSTKSPIGGGVGADISELVPMLTSSEAEPIAEANEMGNVADLAPVSSALEAELNVDANKIGNIAQLVPMSPSLEDEPIVDANTTENSAARDDLLPSLDFEEKIDIDNTQRSDDGGPSSSNMPQTDSIETITYWEKSSTTELFLTSGAASLPHPTKALTGREDAYFLSRQDWLGVADGVGQWSLEGTNTGTGTYARELMIQCENIALNDQNFSTIRPAEVLTRVATETQSPGTSTVLVMHFDGQTLHVANVGDTGFIIIRDGTIFKKSTPTVHEFNLPFQMVTGDDPSEVIEECMIDLNDGDVIVTATDGFFDNLYDQEIVSIISKSLQARFNPQEIAEFLAMRAQEVGRSSSIRSPFADAAQAAGYVEYTGGKLDDVTVIVSLVQNRSISLS